MVWQWVSIKLTQSWSTSVAWAWQVKRKNVGDNKSRIMSMGKRGLPFTGLPSKVDLWNFCGAYLCLEVSVFLISPSSGPEVCWEGSDGGVVVADGFVVAHALG